MRSSKVSVTLTCFVFAWVAQNTTAKPKLWPDYMSCLWTVVEPESPYNIETWTSGDFDAVFPTRPGQAYAKHLANDFWARFSYYDDGSSANIMAEIVRNPNNTVAFNTTRLESYHGKIYFTPVTMVARYPYPYPSKTRSEYLQVSMSCWYVQAHKPFPPYPGMPR